MFNIEQILTEFNVEIPDGKKEEFVKKVLENYKTVAEYQKVTKKRDELKESLDNVQGELEKFKDVDVDNLKSQISTLTTQLADEKNAREKDAEKARIEKNVSEFLAEKKFVNKFTEKTIRESLITELDKDTAKGRSIEDIFTDLITDEEGHEIENILVNPNGKKKPFFTGGSGNNGGKSGHQKLSEMTLDARMALKKKDPELYAAMKQDK